MVSSSQHRKLDCLGLPQIDQQLAVFLLVSMAATNCSEVGSFPPCKNGSMGPPGCPEAK